MDRLIKVDEKTSVNNIIHVSQEHMKLDRNSYFVICIKVQHQKILMASDIE